jgi:hypothetical protein
MTEARSHAERYIAVWNEQDTERRRDLIASSWTEDALYVDPLMRAEGRREIDGLVEAVQARFPDFRFSLIGDPDGHGENLRFSWGLGPENGEPIVKGTDFALLEGGRLKAVHGFLDLVPAGA